MFFRDLGHVAGDNALGETFDDRRLTHARFADQHRIVLGAPREHLDDATDFFIASDDGIELAPTRLLGQVARIALERLVFRFGILVGKFCEPRTTVRALRIAS